LHEAAIEGSINIINLLIENGADVLIQSNDLSTPLHLSKNREVFDLLMSKGAKNNGMNQKVVHENILKLPLNRFNREKRLRICPICLEVGKIQLNHYFYSTISLFTVRFF